MSREKQTKKEMRSELDNLLEATGLGADFLSKKEKREFIKYVQDMGETLPPKEFHTGHIDYKYAFSGDWGNVDLKLAELPNSFEELNKEKQIEEMTKDIPSRIVAYNSDPKGQHLYIEQRNCVAEALYNAGYRKQRVGEWIKPSAHSDIICSQCNRPPKILFGIAPLYCPNCGAKMRKEDEGK